MPVTADPSLAQHPVSFAGFEGVSLSPDEPMKVTCSSSMASHWTSKPTGLEGPCSLEPSSSEASSLATVDGVDQSPCLSPMLPLWTSKPPGLGLGLRSPCSSESASTEAPSPAVPGYSPRPSADYFWLPEGALMGSEPSSENDMFSPYLSALAYDVDNMSPLQASALPPAVQQLQPVLPPVLRKSFSALCVEPSRLMLRRGEVDVRDKEVSDASADLMDQPRASLSFDGLCLEFNPERLPYLNAVFTLPASSADHNKCDYCIDEHYTEDMGDYTDDHYTEELDFSMMTAVDSWDPWQLVDTTGHEFLDVATGHEFEMNVQDVLPAGCTTVMLRNIPNKYTQGLLAERLHSDGYWGLMDFLYLPMDFRQKVNAGYAFISFRIPEAAARFTADYHMAKCWEKLPGFNSQKICEVAPARFQGREANVERLRGSAVMSRLSQTPDWLPMLFDEYGQLEPFPLNGDLAYP